MGWKETDERLIRRGELILDIESLKNHREELKKMNKGKRGPNYRIADSYIQLLSAVRYLYQMPYRQLEGYTRILHKLVPELPPADYSGIRKRIQRLPTDPYNGLRETSDPVSIAVDSTGISVQKAGGWVERKHGKKKRYVKLHFAVDIESKEVVAMEISTDDMHDVKAFPGLILEAGKRRRVTRCLGDGAYDSGMVYEALEAQGIEAVIKPRRNSRPAAGSSARGRAVEEFLDLGYEAWACERGYGMRWMVETAYSTFKRLFGECSLSRTLENIAHELVAKVALYNLLVNM
jgi:hypothetical protein